MRIPNWKDFQHYTKRNPPWIKLHKKILDNEEFAQLPVTSRALAPLIWLIASESDDGKVPDVAKIAWRLRMSVEDVAAAYEPLVTAGFVKCEHDACEVLARCKQDSSVRREEKRREEEQLTPVQPPSSPSVDSRSDADAERARTREALQDLRRREHAFSDKTDQEILDRPIFHAPSGPVRIDTCSNVMLLRATTGKVTAYGQAKPPKPSKASREFLVTEAALRAEAQDQADGVAWIRDNWPSDADPQTEADLRGLIAALKPPLHLATVIEAELFARYPKADADWAARIDRMRNQPEPNNPAETSPALKSPEAA